MAILFEIATCVRLALTSKEVNLNRLCLLVALLSELHATTINLGIFMET